MSKLFRILAVIVVVLALMFVMLGCNQADTYTPYESGAVEDVPDEDYEYEDYEYDDGELDYDEPDYEYIPEDEDEEDYEEVIELVARTSEPFDLTVPSLAELFEPYFLFGNIYSSTARMDIGNTREWFLHHFNTVTAENWHKPDHIAPVAFNRPDAERYDFTRADAVVNWAIENDLTLVGHVLVWHSQSPAWLFNSGGQPITRAEARDNMEFHIRTLAEHFTAMGTIDAFHSWDVVNEAIASGGGTWGAPLNDWHAGDWRTQLRMDSPWFMAYANGYDSELGEQPSDFIYDAFVFARRYFPNSILYYNDYNEEIPAKRNAIGQMVEQLNERWAHDLQNNPEAVAEGEEYTGRLLVEGIGMQSHYHLNQWATNLNNVRPAIERFIATGAVISITELDITIGGQGGNHPNTLPAPLDAASQLRQAEVFARLFGYYLEFSDYIERVTVWGKFDNQSWRAWGHPLLFDAEFRAKEAFFAVVDSVN